MGRDVVFEQVVLAVLVSVLVVVDQAALETKEVVEAMRPGAELLLVTEVPLANERGAVAVVLQQLRQRVAGRSQALVTGATRGAERHLDAHALLVTASQ